MPIGVFEVSVTTPLILLMAPLMTFAAFFFVTPFIKPRGLRRFLWTYLVPAVPLATCWDGVVSLLRVYSAPELEDLTARIPTLDYVWEIGEASTGTPIFTYTYLLGYPVEA